MATGILGEWRRLQLWPPGRIQQSIDCRLRAYAIALIFLLPATDEGVMQGKGHNGMNEDC